MSPPGDGDDVVSSTESDNDDAFDEDMEALRRACLLTGTDPSAATAAASSDSDDDDLELLRSVQQQFSVDLIHRPLSLRPICQLPPSAANLSDDDDDDDFETLRAIQRRFASYTTLNEDILDNEIEDLIQKPELPTTASKDTFNHSSKNASNGYESFLDDQVPSISKDIADDSVERQTSGFIEWHQSDVPILSTLPLESSNFPKSAHMFFEAIKKNRLCQKFIRSKLIHIEARIEENKNLKERFKILKDFQTACRRRTGVAFSQKKDPRVQLITAQKAFPSNNSKIDDKKGSGMYYGPAENSHVGNYRMALTKYPLSLERKKWSDTEKENLGKGIKQQFQEMMLQISIDHFSHSDVSAGESNSIDSILETIKDHEISLDQIREFLPKVNWDQLASMYVAGRSGAECEARWLNCEDPLINHSSWTSHEDKNLLLIIQEIGISNWFNIAASLRTNRTPFQCLARYQRSLNACILKGEWTKEEDDQLRIAVETFGESDWQAVASTLEGRAGTQCSNRWKKSLHPSRRQTGRWASDEDKRLKVAVMLFGPKNWKKIAQFVPGRTQVQCRERWVNSLDPSLKWGEWTEEEDSRLREAIVEHGYCWSKVAACVPPRTDSQCSRRWKVLVPDDVPLLREAKKIKKAIPGNFVDRESERPALGPKDFIPVATCSKPASESVNSTRKCKRKRRVGAESYQEDAASSRKKKRAPKKPLSNNMSTVESGNLQNQQDTDNNSLVLLPPGCLELGTANGCGIEASTGVTTSSKKKKRAPKKPLRRNLRTEECILRNQQDMDNQGFVLPPDCLESGTTSGHGIEASNGATTSSISKKRAPRKPSRRNLRIEESGILWNQQNMNTQGLVLPPDCLESGTSNGHGIEVSNGAITSSISKKRTPKKPLKSNISTKKSANLENQLDMDNQSIVLPPGCLELETSRSGFEASHGAITAPKKNRKAPKKPSRNTVTSGDLQNHEEAVDILMSSGTNDGFDVVPGLSCPQPPPLVITNDEEVQLIGWDATAGGKRAPKLRSRRKMSKKPPQAGNTISSTPVSSEVMINDGDRVESHCIDKVASSEKHCTLEQLNSGTKIDERSPKKLQVYSRRRFRRLANQTCCNGAAPESSSSHKAQS